MKSSGVVYSYEYFEYVRNTLPYLVALRLKYIESLLYLTAFHITVQH